MAQSFARLCESDLLFVIETVATERRDYEHIAEVVRDKPDVIEVMLDDEKLFRRVMGEENILLKISPHLLFTILLRRAHKELKRESYTVERISPIQRVPVFDSERVTELLNDKRIRDYLVGMLSSFTKIESTTLYVKAGRVTYRRRYCDMDIDDMIELCQFVEEEQRFPFYQRIGDISLFLIGMFPEWVESEYRYPLSKEIRPRIAGKRRRSMEEYEKDGREFYRLAAEHESAKMQSLDNLLNSLADNFTLAKKPLTFISERYIQLNKLKWFEAAL